MIFFTGPAPDVLVICPPPLNTVSEGPFADILIGAKEKSHVLADAVTDYCKESNIKMIDAGKVLSLSDADGIHLKEPEHLKLGEAVAAKVKTFL